jgi:hypothetical protein
MRIARSIRAGVLGFCGSMMLSLLGVASTAHAATIDLGQAGNFAVFTLNHFELTGSADVIGDVAVGGSTNFASPAIINGTVFLNTGVPQQGTIVPTGGFVTKDLSQAITDAKNAANNLAALAPTQNLGAIGNNVTITGNGGVNVINASDINMSAGKLVLKGGANDVFVINDSGGFKSANASMSLQGGVTANHVIFNVKGDVTIAGGGSSIEFDGTILAPNSTVSISDKMLIGAIVAQNVQNSSGFRILGTRVAPGPSPLVATMALVAVLGLGYYVLKLRGGTAAA